MNKFKDEKIMSFNKAIFLRTLNQAKSNFGIPANREVIDVQFINNTIVLKHSPKK